MFRYILWYVFGGNQRHPWVDEIPSLNSKHYGMDCAFIALSASFWLYDPGNIKILYFVLMVLCYFRGISGVVRLIFLSLLYSVKDGDDGTFLMALLMIELCVYSMIKFRDPNVKISWPWNKETKRLTVALVLFFFLFVWFVLLVEHKMKIVYFLCYTCLHAFEIYTI
jgi:hypothetical protein